MFVSSVVGFAAHVGAFGDLGVALGSYLAFFLPFIVVPAMGWATKGKFYLVPNTTDDLDGAEHQCCLCENTFDNEDMSFCPAYNQPICSLCCSLDVRCGDQCREDATLSSQAFALFNRYFSLKTLRVLSTPIAQCLWLTLLLTGISATILLLIYWQIPMATEALKDVFAATLLKIFFFLLIIIGAVSYTHLTLPTICSV